MFHKYLVNTKQPISKDSFILSSFEINISEYLCISLIIYWRNYKWYTILGKCLDIQICRVGNNISICCRGISVIDILFPFLGNSWESWSAADSARDLQLVHHHFCILQEKCCKLEGKKLLKLFSFMHLMFYYQVIANAEFFSRNNRVIENAKLNQTRVMIMLCIVSL